MKKIVIVVTMLVVTFGTIAVITNLHQTENDDSFHWIYNGNTYSIDFSISDMDMEIIDNCPMNRAPIGTSDEKLLLFKDIALYSKNNGTSETCVERLNRVLKDEYPSNDRNDYASYVLVFVRSYVSYGSDFKNYSSPDWAAFPEETLKIRSGDCEDHAILCASLLYSAGYDCGIALFEDHAIAMVSLDGYAIPGDTEYNECVYSHNGKTYYGFDSTGPDSCPIGLNDRRYRSEEIISFVPVN